MKIQPINFALTVINLLLLLFLLWRAGPAVSPGIVRARGLEIVDGLGRLRAQIVVLPPTTMPDGTQYAESTLLRLIDPNGRPGVKLATSVDGSGLGLAGDSEKRDWSGVQIIADGSGSTLKLTNKDGHEQLIAP